MPYDRSTIDNKLEEAISFFKQGEYRKALDIYTEIIRILKSISESEIRKLRVREYRLSEKPLLGYIAHPKLVSVLDQRAATYEKLKKLPKALKDGEEIIKIDPLSCKGYLRTSKILLRSNRETDAYRLLQQGKFTISKAVEKFKIEVPEKLFNSIKTQYDSLNKSLKRKQSSTIHLEENTQSSASATKTSKKRKKTLDPFLVLPKEIMSRIFSFISVADTIRSHLVCKLWYSCLTGMPELYCACFSIKAGVTANEFANGMNFMKKITSKSNTRVVEMLKLKSAQSSSTLNRILNLLANEKYMNFRGLDVSDSSLSFELFATTFFQHDFCPLKKLEKLRLCLCSSLKFGNLLFKITNHLRSLEIVVIDQVDPRAFSSIVPRNSKFEKLCEEEEAIYKSLESLVSVNYASQHKEARFSQSVNSVGMSPPFLKMKFPNLTKLCIVSYDFTNNQALFQGFLSSCSALEEIYLENNEKITIKDFLNDLISSGADFKLKKLTIREKYATGEVSLSDIEENLLPQLFSLQHLDIYSSSLSAKGLFKLLRTGNLDCKLTTLIMGNSSRVYFVDDRMLNRTTSKISLVDILNIVPSLERLHLNEMDLDNATMKFFNRDITNYGVSNIKLKVLDLSFCTNIDGLGLMNLFNFQSPISLFDELILDGLEFNTSTLNYIKTRGYAKRIKNDRFKLKWRQYGSTSLVLGAT